MKFNREYRRALERTTWGRSRAVIHATRRLVVALLNLLGLEAK